MTRSRVLSFGLAALLVLGAAAVAQESGAARKASAEAFLAQHGGAWQVVPQVVSGNPGFAWGGRFSLPVAPRTPAAYEAAARQVVDANRAFFGFDSASLVLRAVKSLNLSRAGSSDKVAVTFDQLVDGIPVYGGTAAILFDAASGDVLALDTTGVPFAQETRLVPGSSASDAIAAAEAAYAQHFGLAAGRVDAVDVAILGANAYFGWKSALTGRGPTLAYVVDLSTPGIFTREYVPAQGRVYVSAEGDLAVFKVVPRAFAIDGNVSGNVNTGQEPNTTTNQETPPLPNMWVRLNNASGSVLATTNASGAYSTGTSGPSNLFFELRGPYVNVNNAAAADSTFTLSGVSGSGNNVLFNPTKAEFPTAEVAGFYWVNVFRQWVVAVDPTDNTMDFSVLTNVNKNDMLCNAYFDYSSINLERAGSGCDNTAYADVIIHEEGHWANDVYQGSVSGAFHEGNADNYAYYISDDPCLTTFQGTGCLRTALQTSILKCPTDGDESCHGGSSHTEGQALASAVWAVRARLGTALGDAAGDAVANALFSAWMNVYNDAAILNVILDHWLVLDDDNGNLADGTPHSPQIYGGFGDYGWPAPPDVSISVTSAPAINAQVGHLTGTTVIATITSAQGTITGASLRYAVGSGSFNTVAMIPTGGTDEYFGQIPGVASPATMRWYVSATSSAGGSATSPASAPDNFNLYHVGQLVILGSYTFEAATDESWTHANLSGTYGDQWHRANPAGSSASTDPDAAYSPVKVWGTDLSTTGSDGLYEPSCSGELRSPIYDLSASSSVRMQYRRWLTVEKGIYDQADIRVNNTLVWQNNASTDHLDGAWTVHDLDITAQAALNPSVQIKYRMTSDGGVEFGGWNIDDFMLYRVDASSCPGPSAYGSGELGSTGQVATMGYSGGLPQVGNPNFAVTCSGVKPNQFGVLFSGDSQGYNVEGWGVILVAGPNFLRTYTTSDGAGAAAVTIPITPAMAGTTRCYQFAFRDAGFGGDVQGANGLSVTFCP